MLTGARATAPAQAKRQSGRPKRIVGEKLLHLGVISRIAPGNYLAGRRDAGGAGTAAKAGVTYMFDEKPVLGHISRAQRTGALAPIDLFAVAAPKYRIEGAQTAQPLW